MCTNYLNYGITPAQYHAGLDKLWAALGMTGVQTKDVFTLASEQIKNQRKQMDALNNHLSFLRYELKLLRGDLIRIQKIASCDED